MDREYKPKVLSKPMTYEEAVQAMDRGKLVRRIDGDDNVFAVRRMYNYLAVIDKDFYTHDWYEPSRDDQKADTWVVVKDPR